MELDYKIKEVQEEADSGHDKDLLSISLKNAYPNDKDLNTIVPYSRTKDVYYKDDPNSNEVKQIHFTTEQREIINTLDRCYKQKRNILNLDAFICNYYNSANYEVKPEERQHFLRALNELAVLAGMRVQTDGEVYKINIGALVPVRIQIEGYVNGVYSKNLIKIDDYSCIYGDENSHSVAYWRLKFPNKYTRKTLKNITISRTVLDSWLTGESVDITALCDELGIKSDKGKNDLITSINQCISYQNEEIPHDPQDNHIGSRSVLPEMKHHKDDSGKRGRPAITAIETKRQS